MKLDTNERHIQFYKKIDTFCDRVIAPPIFRFLKNFEVSL